MGVERDATRARPLVVVMGVSGSGKSTVGALLANRLGVPFADADDFHPGASIAKMASGIPLEDADRRPWLEQVGNWLSDHDAEGGVMSCSALKRNYRDQLRRHSSRTWFLHLFGSREVIGDRLSHRPGHFMPSSLLDSQFSVLEPLSAEEAGMTIDVSESVDAIVMRCLELCLAHRSASYGSGRMDRARANDYPCEGRRPTRGRA